VQIVGYINTNKDYLHGQNEIRKRPVCRADNLTTFMCWLSWKFESLNLLESSGPVQTCTWIALPLTKLVYQISTKSDNKRASLGSKVRTAFIFRVEQFGLITGAHSAKFEVITALLLILYFWYVTLRPGASNSRTLDCLILKMEILRPSKRR
jgi:hypothetical protein